MDREQSILVCQGRCCRKDGSTKVLRAFQSLANPGIQIISCGCLGKCGNGPTVLILPEKIWYQKVTPKDVS
ncbi:MAG: (2Fe-2S) ferredoxin domain-containing protein, partial [Crocosphaera sp.]